MTILFTMNYGKFIPHIELHLDFTLATSVQEKISRKWITREEGQQICDLCVELKEVYVEKSLSECYWKQNKIFLMKRKHYKTTWYLITNCIWYFFACFRVRSRITGRTNAGNLLEFVQQFVSNHQIQEKHWKTNVWNFLRQLNTQWSQCQLKGKIKTLGSLLVLRPWHGPCSMPYGLSAGLEALVI